MKLFIRMNFVLAIVAMLLMLLLVDCSVTREPKKMVLSDDTIVKISTPKPPAIFYDGNFFQYYQIPKIISPSNDTIKN